MRAWVAVPSVLLACLLVAPTAVAHLGAVETEASSTTEAPSDVFQHVGCIPFCETQTTQDGYVSPVTVVESGATVTWVVLEGTLHTATSDVPSEDLPSMLMGQSPQPRDWCMDTEIPLYGAPGEATFRIEDGQLAVYEPKSPAEGWEVCDEALALPGGGFALSYHCNYHPRLQHGAIVVLPPG